MRLHDINEGLKDPKDNPCWKGYHPVGTKKKNGKTVPNCVPESKEEVSEGYGKYWCSTDKKWKERQGPKQTRKTIEAANPAQQAAIAINMKKHHKKPKSEGVAEGWKEKVGAAALAGAVATGAGANTPKVPLDQAIRDATAVYNINKAVKKQKEKSKEETPKKTDKEVKEFVSHNKQGVAEGTAVSPTPGSELDALNRKTMASYGEQLNNLLDKIEFHKQGQAAAQYKGSMNQMHGARIKELMGQVQQLKQQFGLDESTLKEFSMGGEDGEDPLDNYPCYDCGSTIFLHHTKLCELAEPNAIHDLPAKPGSQHWTGEIPKGLHPIPGLQGMAEATGDSKFDDMMGDITKGAKAQGELDEQAVSALRDAVNANRPRIKKVSRKRVDDSTEVRYHVLDSERVTHKVFDDAKFAKEWMHANWDKLDLE